MVAFQNVTPQERGYYVSLLRADRSVQFVIADMAAADDVGVGGPPCLICDVSALAEPRATLYEYGLDGINVPPYAVVLLINADQEAAARAALRSGVHDYLYRDELDATTLCRTVVAAVERHTHRAERIAAEVAERGALLEQAQHVRLAAERTANRLARLQSVTAALSEALTLEQVADAIIAQSLGALEATSCVVRLVDTVQGRLNVFRCAGLDPAALAPWWSLPLDMALPVVEVARSGRPLFFDSRSTLITKFPQADDCADALGYQAHMFMPLPVQGRTIGTLVLTFEERRVFDEDDHGFLLTLASQCALALERARLFVETQNAVQVRDTFIAVAAHDLNSPLASLLGQIHLIERRAARDGIGAQLASSVELLKRQAWRLNRMINALLDLSRIQSARFTLNRASLDIVALLNRIVAEFQPMLTRHQISFDTAQSAVLIDGDALRLEQVFYNLISNAVKYSPAGGEVRLQVTLQADQVWIAVADDGIGIPAADQERIFEQFYRASNSAAQAVSGMGIGLYVVREIVTLHSGTVRVDSTADGGSTFVVCLPRLGQE